MTIEEAIIFGKKYISSTDTKMLISNVKNYDALEIINHLNEELTIDEENYFKNLIEARKENKPLQYIVNSVNFYGIDLYVDERVLIPRFETEELVENTVKYLKDSFVNPKVLDLCCGSGAIGITIKNKVNDSVVTLSDISKDALDVARINIDKYNYDIETVESDLFSNITNKYDCIISNPPYIKENEEIEEIVKNNEPNIALFAGKDGLFYYDKILKEIKNYLNPKFMIAFEIGSTQKEDLINLINKYLDNVLIETKKDLSGRDRMIFIFNK